MTRAERLSRARKLWALARTLLTRAATATPTVAKELARDARGLAFEGDRLARSVR